MLEQSRADMVDQKIDVGTVKESSGQDKKDHGPITRESAMRELKTFIL